MDKTLYISAAGGLANRMRAIASGVAIGQKYGYPVKAVWYQNKDINAPFDVIFETDRLPFAVKEVGKHKYDLFFGRTLRRNFGLQKWANFLIGRKYVKYLNEINRDEIDVELSGLKRSCVIYSWEQFAAVDHELINRLFRPTRRVLEVKEEILDGRKPDVALHIRRTDNKWAIEHSPLELFEAKIEEELERNGDTLFYLATDDNSVKELLTNKYPGKIITNHRKADRTTVEGIIDAVAEMYIMSGCRRIYGSYWSSYSQMSALIGNRQLITLTK